MAYNLDFRITLLFHVRYLGFLSRRGRGRSLPLDWGGGFRSLGPLTSEHGLDSILPLGYRFNERGRFVADLAYVRRHGVAVWIAVGK